MTEPTELAAGIEPRLLTPKPASSPSITSHLTALSCRIVPQAGSLPEGWLQDVQGLTGHHLF